MFDIRFVMIDNNSGTEVTYKTKLLLLASTVYPIILLQHRKSFYLKTSKIVDKGLKNYYITLDKTSINKDKNTYKKQVCN